MEVKEVGVVSCQFEEILWESGDEWRTISSCPSSAYNGEYK